MGFLKNGRKRDRQVWNFGPSTLKMTLNQYRGDTNVNSNHMKLWLHKGRRIFPWGVALLPSHRLFTALLINRIIIHFVFKESSFNGSFHFLEDMQSIRYFMKTQRRHFQFGHSKWMTVYFYVKALRTSISTVHFRSFLRTVYFQFNNKPLFSALLHVIWITINLRLLFIWLSLQSIWQWTRKSSRWNRFSLQQK